MKISDVAALPVQFGAAVRHRRLFHPTGVLAHGHLERTAPEGRGLPVHSSDVVGRLSKGIGTPGSLPDIAGLAWRIPSDDADRPWDVLLASTVAGNRLALWPANSWTGLTLSSLMPVRYKARLWWIRARLTTEFDGEGLSMDQVSEQIERGGIEFDVEQGSVNGTFEPLARLTLTRKLPEGQDVSFDPAIHTPAGVKLSPGWLTDVRRVAYRRSRAGRHAE